MPKYDLERLQAETISAFSALFTVNAETYRNFETGEYFNMRAAYHAAARGERKVSLLISGVSSRWFSVESIDGIENAAMAFIPEEYLSPLPRGASHSMIKNIGAIAGLRFDQAALDAIASFCSDMPFWIRKACSFIHGKIETNIRPITLKASTVVPMLEAYRRDEGAALVMVAMQHLFRVYPELKEPALSMTGQRPQLAPNIHRTLMALSRSAERSALRLRKKCARQWGH